MRQDVAVDHRLAVAVTVGGGGGRFIVIAAAEVQRRTWSLTGRADRVEAIRPRATGAQEAVSRRVESITMEEMGAAQER